MPQQSELLKVIGVRGLSVFSGLVREEYLTDLRSWKQASRVYREMADDAVIGTLLDAIRLPLLASEFDVPPLSDSEADQGAADFLWRNLNEMHRQTWRSHVSDMLESLQFGFAFGEAIFEKRGDGRIWLKNIEPRGQETLERWEWNWEADSPEVFVQRDPSTGALYRIPVDKAIHVTFNGRKGNPQGRPLLRSLFRPWLKLKYLENFEAVGIERDVGGMAVIDFPDPEKWQGPQGISDLKDIFEDAMKNLRMDENMWLLVPPGARASSWGSGQRSYDVRQAIVAKQKELLLRFFAQFLMLEHAGLDASGLLKGSQDFFALALKSVQQQVLEVWQQQLVPLLFSLNSFPGMTGLPVPTWSDPGRVDVAGLVSAMTTAVQSQLLTPIRADEEHVRGLLDLPDLPEDVGEDVRSPAQPQPSFLPFSSRQRHRRGIPRDNRLAKITTPEEAYQALADEIGLTEHPAGQRLRLNPDRFDKLLNDYQKELVAKYDAWNEETSATLLRLKQEGQAAAVMRKTLRARLDDLEVELMTLGRRRIFEAGMMGLGERFGHRAESAGVRLAISQLQRRNDAFLAESLIPDVRRAFEGAAKEPDLAAVRTALEKAGEPFRSRVAGYSGGATVSVWQTQERAGLDENAERRARGEPPIMVRWVLDPEVTEHCDDDPARGTHGCDNLAGVYQDWDHLVTVPAGDVTCISNCKCRLEMSDDGGRTWERP